MKINHRNSLETWSNGPILLNTSMTHTFSTAATQAFGDNQVITSDNLYYALYSGDLNQDGSVESQDFLDLDPSIQAGDGGYVVGDLNGDGGVDATDFLILDANIQIGAGSAIP